MQAFRDIVDSSSGFLWGQTPPTVAWKRLCIWVLGLVLLTAGMPCEAGEPDLHSFVEERVTAVGAPGAAYVVVRNGVAEAHAIGYASRAEDTPMRIDTPLALGSVSKPFTAVAVLQLVEQGRVELDAPVARYLPLVRFGDDRAASRISVRQLLSHTSGFSTFDGNRTQADRSRDPEALRRRVESLSRIRPNPAGTAWRYSNANYQLLGALIEEVAGLRYPDYVRQNILEPLGMTRSFVLDPPPGVEPATGHRRWFGLLRPVRGPLLGYGSMPQGGVYASAEDLGRFLQDVLAEDSMILGREMRAEMLRPQAGAPGQGLGWRVGAPVRPRFAWHGGDNPGFAAAAAFDPETGEGFAIMTNVGLNLVFSPTQSITFGAASQWFDLPPVPAGSPPLFIGVVAFLAFTTIAASVWAVRMWARRPRFSARPPTILRKALAALGAVFFIALAVAVLLIPRFVFGAPMSAAWLFVPDMAILMVVCATSLTIAGALRLWLLARGSRTPRRISG